MPESDLKHLDKRFSHICVSKHRMNFLWCGKKLHAEGSASTQAKHSFALDVKGPQAKA